MREGEGIVIDVKEYGNSSLIVHFLTKEGKTSGFLKGGARRKDRISPLSLIKFKLTKRLEEHLGSLSFESIKSFSAPFLKNKIKVRILCSLQELMAFLLMEESPDEEIYYFTTNLLNALLKEEASESLIESYLKFELKLLSTCGFGLDLTKCALTGGSDVFFLSPLTGKSASFSSAQIYKKSLFEIPSIYGNIQNSHLKKAEDLKNAFNINSHFLSRLPNFDKLSARNKILNLIQDLSANC